MCYFQRKNVGKVLVYILWDGWTKSVTSADKTKVASEEKEVMACR